MIEEAVRTTEEHYAKMGKVLGDKYADQKIDSSFDYLRLASRGIDATVILNFNKYFGLSKELSASMLSISQPTIYRWTKEKRNLDKNFSFKLLDLTDMFIYGEEVFGEKENFFKWLKLPNAALGGIEPMRFLEVPGGIAIVKDVLVRIDYGVYS